jgi:hypothetical protein
MPSADSWERILTNNPSTPTPQTVVSAPVKPTMNFSAWDAADSAIQAAYTPVVSNSSSNSSTTIIKPPVDPTPPVPQSAKTSNAAPSTPAVKVATPEILVQNIFALGQNNPVPIDSMTDLIFQDIGGQEMINISRHDLINGQNIDYQPITNLSDISFRNGPQNIIKLQDSGKVYFDSFPIRLEDYLPTSGTGPNGETIYLDASAGKNSSNIIINVQNLPSDKRVEIEFISYNGMINDIIYL